MKITWSNIDDFKLTKRGKFIYNGSYYVLKDKCVHCKETYFSNTKKAYRGKGLYCEAVCYSKSKCKNVLVQCLWCGLKLKRKLSATKKSKDIFCSHECHVQFRRSGDGCNEIKIGRFKVDNTKEDFCLCCGNALSSKQFKFCSSQCSSDYRYLIYINKWKLGIENGVQADGFSVHGSIRKYFFNKYASKCSRCSWKEVNPLLKRPILEIEHIDGDCTNNDEENLDLICPNCHTLTPTYKALNSGNGNRKRLEYYKLVKQR